MARRIRTSAGFTLIELMVAVAVIAILLSIAIPNYQEYLIKGEFSEAMSLLSDLQVRQEQYYQDNRAYLNGMTPRSAGQYFTSTSCTAAAGGQTYTCTANSPSRHYTFSIDQAGAKSTTKPDGSTASCWLRTPNGAC